MRVTSKGQVTIPLRIRERLGIRAGSEVDFAEDGGRVCLIRKKVRDAEHAPFRRFRGTATVKMTTDEIMELTRG